MSALDFRAQEFGDGNGKEAIALVAGFDGKISHFEHTARDLVSAGKDVVVYEYDNDVFLAGDATILPSLIGVLSEDFLGRTNNYSAHRYAGPSIGGGIGWNMQKDCGDALPGIYAAVGADAAHLVMSNPLFRGLAKWMYKIDPRKEFERNGYTEADLWNEWEKLHIPPETGFAAVLGGLDYIIRLREVKPKFELWQQDTEINLLVKRKLGHTGVIKWFADNSPAVLKLAPDYNQTY